MFDPKNRQHWNHVRLSLAGPTGSVSCAQCEESIDLTSPNMGRQIREKEIRSFAKVHYNSHNLGKS
jgi:hypothetical protein